jgi:hypothetical protein
MRGDRSNTIVIHTTRRGLGDDVVTGAEAAHVG